MKDAPEQINILLVDDEWKNLAAYEAILASPERHLVKANSGTEALKRVLEDEFAAILLDVRMPDLDGFEVARLIRARQKSQTTPILFLTGTDRDSPAISKGYALGAVDYILKPVDPTIVQAKVAVFVELYKKTKQVDRQAVLLAETNMFLSTILDSATEYAIIALDRGGQILTWNEGARRIYGYSAEEVVGRQHLRDLLADEGNLSEKVDALLTTALHSQKVEEMCLGVRKNGQSFPITLTLTLRQDQQRFPIGYSFIAKDSTAQRQAEEKLRQQYAYTAALHDTTLALVSRLELTDLLEAIVQEAAGLMHTSHGGIYLVNKARTGLVFEVATGVFHNYLGITIQKGEGLGGKAWATGETVMVENYSSWTDKLSLYDIAKLRALVGVPLNTAGVVEGVLVMAYLEEGRHFSQEQVKILEQFAHLATLAIGNARLYSAAQHELGERTRAEVALQESETRYRMIFESSPLGIVNRDPAGTVIQTNRAFQELLGYTQEELLKVGVDAYIYPDDLPAIVDLFTTKLAAGQDHYHHELRLIRKDKGLLWVHLEVAVVRTVQREPQYVITMVEDISARKQVEQAQRDLVLSKDRFLSQVSHELRNPLAGVVGFSELLNDRLTKLEQDLNHEVDLTGAAKRVGRLRELAHRVEVQGKQMTKQINDLLDMRRLETGKLSLTLAPCDLAELAMVVIEQQQLTTSRHHLSYSGPSRLRIQADESRLQQVVSNLLSNAIRYAPQGPVEVRLSVQLPHPPGASEQSSQGEAGVYCHIRDEGLGIPAGALPYIFDYTYQVERPDQERRGGLGLGLFLCKEIIELHGGTLSVESQVGKGSTFCFWLPPRLCNGAVTLPPGEEAAPDDQV